MFGDTSADTLEVPEIVPLSQPHREEIMALLEAKGLDAKKAMTWLNSQTSAWGHETLDHFPDEKWETLRDALLERVRRVEEARASKAKEKDHGQA
jgi:hypothetical protein